MRPLEAELRRGVGTLGLALQDTQIGQLLDYVELLVKWNGIHNLTAVREPAEILTHHLLDCLAVVRPLRRRTEGRVARLLDVGSGAGLPGAVIAISCEEVGVTCLDAVAKKAAFVRQVALALGLGNLQGRHGRVEAVAEPFDIISARAFSSLADLVAGSRQALAPGGAWLAMKGKNPDEELKSLASDTLFHVEQLEVPGLEAQRCIVWMQPAPGRGAPLT